MGTPSLSVIIPTHKRAEILKDCLAHLEKQTIAPDLEVIVVSDGHDDATAALFTDLNQYKFHVTRYFEIEKSQQGVARNRGLRAATAPFVLFIGDDIFLTPEACAQHVTALKLQDRNMAVLGMTTWDTAIDITPAMRWLENTGWQFGYSMLTQYQHNFIPKDIQHRFTYTSNISLPTDIARQHFFREDVTLYGWEDTLWGQELAEAGIPLYYEPNAMGLHHHAITMDDSLARIETLGKSLLHLTKVAPQLDRKPTGLKLWAYKLIAMTPTMRGRHYKAFLRGLDEKNEK